MVWWAAAAMGRECGAGTPLADHRAAVQALDALPTPEQRHEAVSRLLGELRCVAEPLPPADAAELHRRVAADARWSGDEARARAAEAAAERIAPADPTAQPKPSLTETFGTSLAARVYVDGAVVSARIVGQPAVVQVFGVDGAPIDAAWVAPGQPLPDWVAFPTLSCAGPVAIDVVLAHVADAERAYTALDVAGFERSLENVAVGLPCVTGRVGSAQAAAIHRLEGLRQFAHGSDASALRSFQEARILDPTFVPAADTIRPGSALDSVWALAGTAGVGGNLVERVPEGLRLEVDGVPSSTRPAALPAIVQLTDELGVIRWTRYVPPGVRLPDFTSLGLQLRTEQLATLSPARAVYASMAERRVTSSRRIGLFAGSALAYTLGGATWLVNTTAYAEYMDRDTPQERLGGLRTTANAAATTSTLSIGLGTALLVGAVVSR